MVCTQRHHAPRSTSSVRNCVVDGDQFVGRDVEGDPIAWFSGQVVALLDGCVVDVEHPDPQFVATARGQQHRRGRPGPRHVDRGPRDPALCEFGVGDRDGQRPVRDIDARLLRQPAGQRVGFGQRHRARMPRHAVEHDGELLRPGIQVRCARQPCQPGVFEIAPQVGVELDREPGA